MYKLGKGSMRELVGVHPILAFAVVKAIEITKKANILVIIGTSMQVYPAASLIHYIPINIPIYFIDPKPNISNNSYDNLTVFSEKASVGVEKLISILK